MTYVHHERLTALDALFLGLENHDVHMHVGAVALFEGDKLRTSEGKLDFDKIHAFVECSLHKTPRFRQRLARVPVLGQPVWIDDARFNLDYHLRHTALPAPGSLRQLKRLAGRVMSQKLEREKPLWEIWVVEGLEDGRFALIWKMHHCLVDGVAGIELLASLLRIDEDDSLPQPCRWIPRPSPSPSELLLSEVQHRLAWPWSMLGQAPRWLQDPTALMDRAVESLRATGETLAAGLAGTSPTPFNTDIGPYRRYDWARLDMGEIKRVRAALGGTLNDVVLATVAGAVGRFLRRRGQMVAADTAFRVMVPVSVRKASEYGEQGNHVVNYLVRLPIHVEDPAERLHGVIGAMTEVKRSRVAAGTELFEELSDHTFTGLLEQVARLAAGYRAFNVVVTNVPGPPFPVYLLGARMEEIYPVVPLFDDQGLGIALFSYDRQLCWGLTADWDVMPDLHELVLDVEEEFRRLAEATVPSKSDAAPPVSAAAVPKRSRPKRVAAPAKTRQGKKRRTD